MWSGSNSGLPRGGAASIGYAGLVVWVWVEVEVGGRWLGLGLHLSSLSLDLFISGWPRGGAASMGYAGLVVGAGLGLGSVVGAGFPSLISLPRSLHFTAKRKKKSSVLLVFTFFCSRLTCQFFISGQTKPTFCHSRTEVILFGYIK
jgi:hypothetical protein